KLMQGLKKAQAQLKAFGTTASTMGRSMVTTAALAAFPIAMATRTFRQFDDEMRFVKATTQATGAEFDMLTKKARDLGRTTSFTAQQVASGMAELGKAGFSSREIDKSIADVMNLARATRTDLPTAVQIATNALRVFKLEASQMGEVVDVLVTTANNSTTSLVELGESFQYSSSNMQLAGETVNSTAKALGALAIMGLKGSMAGTALNQVINQLADRDVISKLESMGVAVGELNAVTGQMDMRPVGDILVDIGKAMAGMGEIEKLQIG
ncbi:unnamed protein product, partial [marine sediment metagenome]